jgi:hypothetical protein
MTNAVIFFTTHWLTISAICQAKISEIAHRSVRPLMWLVYFYCYELAVKVYIYVLIFGVEEN